MGPTGLESILLLNRPDPSELLRWGYVACDIYDLGLGTGLWKVREGKRHWGPGYLRVGYRVKFQVLLIVVSYELGVFIRFHGPYYRGWETNEGRLPSPP